MRLNKHSLISVGAAISCLLLPNLASAQTLSMQDLLNGASFTLPADNGCFLTFSNFSNYHAMGPSAPTASELFATAIDPGTHNPGPGLRWQSSHWNVNAGESMDTGWDYDVTVFPSPSCLITEDRLELVSFAADNGADIHITESLSNGQNMLVEATNSPFRVHHGPFPGVTTLHVGTDVSLTGGSAPNGAASLSTFDQHFAVPEPGSVAMLVGMTISGSLLARRRTKKS